MKIPHLCLLIIYIYLTKVYTNEFKFVDEGWRPLTIEEVYRGLLTSFQKPNNIQHVDNSWNRAAGYEDINLLTNEAIKLVKPQQVHREFQIKREGSYPVEKETIEFTNQRPESVNKCETKESKICPEIGKRSADTKESSIITYKNEPELNKTTRKAKKIDEKLNSESKNDLVITSKHLHSNDDSIRSLNKHGIKGHDETYEVTEHIENLDLANGEQTNADENSGYVYKPPDNNNFNPNHSNLTSTLLKILSKYKINDKDEPRNYELSRISSNQGTFRPDFMYLPIPIRSIGSYNSLDHLPVNPVLAVLLSHYGHYLPGSYGLQNNYRNLYGYLASNNIHNNRPFGLYKVFSDTDSSNK